MAKKSLLEKTIGKDLKVKVDKSLIVFSAVFGKPSHKGYWKDGDYIPHCLEGPTTTNEDGTREWWIDGIQYETKAKWKAALAVHTSKIGKLRDK